jgi:hypothetical protein
MRPQSLLDIGSGKLLCKVQAVWLLPGLQCRMLAAGWLMQLSAALLKQTVLNTYEGAAS